MRLILVGPPGAGKGTQAKVVAAALGVPHISTGDIFRSNVAGGTDLGRQAQEYMDAGRLVPDSLTNQMVQDRLGQPDAANGFLLDGYPRNLAQVVVLDQILTATGASLDAAVELAVDRDEVTARLLDRARVEGRADDTEDVIRHRLDIYDAETTPIVDHYRSAGLLRVVDGLGAVEEVTARVLAALGR